MARPKESGYGSKILTAETVGYICQRAGFRGEALVTAIAVCQAESSFNVFAINSSARGGIWGDAVGLFQVRCLVRPELAGNALDRGRITDKMLDARANAYFAYQLSNQGRNFKPWSAYTNGAYRKYLDGARTAALTPSEYLPETIAGSNTVAAVGNEWIDTDSPALPVALAGSAHPGDLGNAVVAAVLELSMAEASIARLEIEDEYTELIASGDVDEGSPLTVNGTRHTVTAVGITQGPATPHVTVESQPAGVVRLRGVTPTAATQSPLVYARNLATAAGLAFVGGPDLPATAIEPATVQLAGSTLAAALDPTTGLVAGTRPENAWEVLRRTAQATPGYVCYESAGTLYFAAQDWLMAHAGTLYVQVGSAAFTDVAATDPLRALAYPTITRRVRRDAQGLTYKHVEATVELPAGPGYRARPGMRLWLAEPSGLVAGARPMLIQDVNINLDDLTKKVVVRAASYAAPGDAESQPATVTGAAPGLDASSGKRTATTSQNGWPASPNPADIDIVTIEVPGSGVRLRVTRPASALLLYVATEWHNTVEPLRASQCGGYNYRRIRGGSSISNHGSGTALDLNSIKHGLGARGTFTASQVAAIRRILAACNGAIRWGGDYRGRADEMHVEVVADPIVVKARPVKVPKPNLPTGV